MPRSTKNKHQEKSEATRRKLFAAALRVFLRDGFEAARIEDIAAEAGFTRGAFYAHFPSKEDLFFALVEQEMQKHLTRLRTELENCTDEASRLLAFRNHYATRSPLRAWSILILEFKLYAIRHPRIRAQLVRSYRSIREKLKVESLWQSAFCGVKGDSGEKELLHAALNGLVLQRAYDPSSISAAQMASLLGSLFDCIVGSKLPQPKP
ncbi:MAG TPA: TetR/AcrR family transcriptional regulator [Bryobacteraceae bacterium]|jgi:AcrR family transcriptional regulator|nr:TetR/AcrR family transcriptional regulator [Bryobacteraceae bacterium]